MKRILIHPLFLSLLVIGPSAAALIAALMSAAVTFLSSVATRSTQEPSGTGTRIAKPLSLPFRSGMTLPTALAAPVLDGMML